MPLHLKTINSVISQSIALCCISGLLLLVSCSSAPPAQSFTPHPKMILAKVAFDQGNWQKLSQLIPELPTDQPFYKQEIDFYFFFIEGLTKSPQKAMQQFEAWSKIEDDQPKSKEDIKKLQNRRDIFEFYHFLFKARMGNAKCLVAVGPLENIYKPKLDELGIKEGSKKLLRKTLEACDSGRHFSHLVESVQDEENPKDQDPRNADLVVKPKALELPTDHQKKAIGQVLSDQKLDNTKSTTVDSKENTNPVTAELNANGIPIDPNANTNSIPADPNANINSIPADPNANTNSIPADPNANTNSIPADPNANINSIPADPNANTTEINLVSNQGNDLSQQMMVGDGEMNFPILPILRAVAQAPINELSKIESHIVVFLPLTDPKQKENAKRLEATLQYLKQERMDNGIPIRFTILDNSVPAQLEQQILELPQSAQAIVGIEADHFSKTLALILSQKNDALGGKPFIAISNSQSALQAPQQLWRFFPAPELVTKSIIQLAIKAGAKRAGAIYLQGTETGLESFKKAWIEGGEWVDSIALPKEKPDFKAIAEVIAQWDVDSLFFVNVDASRISELVTYLATVNVWSEKAKGAKGKKLKYFLWPIAYEPKLLTQASRYLEGAMLVNPTQAHLPISGFFERNAKRMLKRNLGLRDLCLIDAIDQLDHHIRLAQLKNISVKESFREAQIEPRFFAPFSYQNTDLIETLQELSIYQGAFNSYPPKEANPSNPSNPNNL